MKRHASMNRTYRLVWNPLHHSWVAVAENAKGQGKTVSARRLVAAALMLLAPLAQAAPSGGVVTAGTGTIAQAGTNTTITQQSTKLAIDWNSFSVAANEAVNFSQPSAAAIALNRVLGANGSEILGSLTANGQVFILNPNGVLFGSGAQVNVGGLVASTLSLNNTDFMAGNYVFSNNGATGTVVNQGNLAAANSGYVALLGNNVSNQGTITATLGTALLGAGDQVTLTLNNGSLLGYSIDQGTLNALAENKQLVRADGGLVVLSAQAANAVSTAVVNNSGLIEARTVQNRGGVIRLLGDMQRGRVKLSGTLDASAPTGGNGGSVETSAAQVSVAPSALTTTAAPQGASGNWLIDSAADSSIGVDINPVALSNSLDAGNVTVQTGTTGVGTGYIFVDTPVSWASANKLTLNAYHHIGIYAPISNTVGGSLVLRADRTGTGMGSIYFLGGSVNLSGGGRADLYYNPISGTYAAQTDYAALMGTTPYSAWMLVNSAGQLQRMNTNLAGNYALGRDIDANATIGWNAGAGFAPVGGWQVPFTGQFDGLNHTIIGLTINRPVQELVGLFGANSGSVRNVNLSDSNAAGRRYVGGLVGANHGSIVNAHTSGMVSGAVSNVGGLVGQNFGSIVNADAGGTVNGAYAVGGLVGASNGSIINAQANCTVNGVSFAVGGLVGHNGGSVIGARANGVVNGTSDVGGLVGRNGGRIADVSASGNIHGNDNVGGLAGYSNGRIVRAFASGNVTGSGNVLGGLVGDNWGEIDTAYAIGNVTGAQFSTLVGGLTGYNTGSISTAYATGAVSGGAGVGGLVGRNTAVGTMSTVYSTGAVSGTSHVGGLAGNNFGAVNGAYWDMLTSGQTGGTGAGNVLGITGLTSAQMKNMASFAGWNIANNGGSAADWRIYEGSTAPLLRNFLTPLTVTANDAAGKTYDGLAYSGGNGVTFSAVPNANLIGTLSYGGTAQGAVDAGSYTITPGGYYSNQRGYDISFVDGALTVNPAALTVTANNATKTYDGLAHSGGNGATYTGLVNGETSAVLGGTLTYGGTSQGAVNTGSYVITPGGLTSGNYTISYADGALTVNPAPLTVTANDATKSYDFRPYSGGNGVTYSGLVNGETSAVLGGTLAYGGTSQGAVNPGSYAITPSGLSSGNYAITYVDGTLTIKPWFTFSPLLPVLTPLNITPLILTPLTVTPLI